MSYYLETEGIKEMNFSKLKMICFFHLNFSAIVIFSWPLSKKTKQQNVRLILSVTLNSTYFLLWKSWNKNLIGLFFPQIL